MNKIQAKTEGPKSSRNPLHAVEGPFPLDRITSPCDKLKMGQAVYYSYIRFSTPDQQNGDSLRRQLDAARAYVEEQGGILDESFRDLGISAYRGANVKEGSSLGTFLTAVEDGTIKTGSFLIVEAIDRISRNEPMEQLELLLKIIRKGISIVTLFDKRVYSRETLNRDLSASIYLQALISRGHEESRTKATRVGQAWKAKRASNAPMTAKCPAWLRLVTKDGKKQFEAIPEHTRVIQDIFNWAAKGQGKVAIAKKLQNQKVASWGSGKLSRKGEKTGWYPSYIKKILGNRAVLGEFQPHTMQQGKRVAVGNPKVDYFPRVISDDLFITVQGQRKRNSGLGGRKSVNVHNLFPHLAFCGQCRAPLHYKNHGKWQYLVCSGWKRDLGCKCAGWAYDDFEATFIWFIRELNYTNILTGQTTQHITNLEDRLALQQGMQADVSERLAKLKALLKDNPTASGLEVLSETDKEATDLNAQVQQTSSELGLARQNQQVKVDLTEVFDRLSDSQFRTRLQAEIRRLVKRIDVFPMGLDNDKRHKFIIVQMANGAVKQVHPSPNNPITYKLISDTSPDAWHMPSHTYGQQATVFVSEDGHTLEYASNEAKPV